MCSVQYKLISNGFKHLVQWSFSLTNLIEVYRNDNLHKTLFYHMILYIENSRTNFYKSI